MTWRCTVCTLINDDLETDKCAVCQNPRFLSDIPDIEAEPAYNQPQYESEENSQHDSPPNYDEDSPFYQLMLGIHANESRNNLAAYVQQGADVNAIDKESGETPLIAAVKSNSVECARALIELRADVSLEDSDGESALNHAVCSQAWDGTEMARMLLSKGANFQSLDTCELPNFTPELISQNLLLSYWLRRARTFPLDPSRREYLRTFELESLDEIEFGIIGEMPALRMILNKIQTFFFDWKGHKGKPLVMMLPGPPGHGKTFLTRNIAKALVGDDNYIEIPCGTLKDDADLFGSNLGGLNRGKDGRLTEFLRTRQNTRTVVFLDEFEKINGLTSSLGWGQAKKMYQSFLEPWMEGTLTDVSTQGGVSDKIKCDQTIFICTTNEGQHEILQFAEKHRDRCYGKLDTNDINWIQKNLVAKELMGTNLQDGVLKRFFRNIDRNLQALVRRIDLIAPFLPLTEEEQAVLADHELRQCLQSYREAPVHEGSREDRRLIGHLIVHHDESVCRSIASHYDGMEGASSLHKPCRRIVDILHQMWLCKELDRAPRITIDGYTEQRTQIWLSANDEDDLGDDFVIRFTKPEPRRNELDEKHENMADSVLDQLDQVEEAPSISAKERLRQARRR